MKARLLLLVLMLGALPLITLAEAGPRDAQWKKVDDAMAKGLPKTAIEELEPIIAGALKDKAYAEAAKAIARKIALEGNIQGNKPEEKITRMQAEIAKAPPEMVPILEAIQANWYWHYFQQNRWRFLQRTDTSAPPGPDFTTWSLPQILAEIDRHFTRALADDKTLRNTPIAQYDDLLDKGTMPDSYRPTLYDFIAHEALAFYTSGEQAGARAEDAFELTADSPIFAPAEEFLKWNPASTDTASLMLRAIHLYQELLKFHQNDKDPSAFLDDDLDRLTFGNNQAVGENKNARYKAALQHFVEKNGDSPISARARYSWASVLQQEGDLVQARKLAQQGAQAFPNDVGGRLCYNLVQQIEAKTGTVSTERVWNEPWPVLQVRYRNLTKVYFRAVSEDFEGRIQGRNQRPEDLDEQERQALLSKKAAKEWSADLPATKDYHERLEKLPVPKDLKPGFYYLMASFKPDFSAQDNQVVFSPFWVSNLALVMRFRQGEGDLEGFVLDTRSGEPLSGVEVRAWTRTFNTGRTALPATQTDANGLFRFTGSNNQMYLVLARNKDQELATYNDFYLYRYDNQVRPFTQTVFFTDRSLYRPGQTIQYKGICLQVDQQAAGYQVLGNQVLTVIFADPNGKEVARQQHRTNDYGSFSGSFTAPTDRLMGQMSIRVEGQPPGQVSFNVEEYKRPKFEVTLDKPKEAPRLNAPVTLQGKATAYTGAAVDGGKVTFRVVREVRYPPWWGWYYWWRTPQQNSQEIAHGATVTETDGTFKINFVARPDASVPEKEEPTFHYVIHADVTDNAGETRSGQQEINVGYKALQAALTADDWQTKDQAVKITLKTTTLDGEGQRAEGTLKVYRLKPPDKVQRPALANNIYYPVPVMRDGKEAEPEPDLSNPNSWPLGEVVAEKGFNTDPEGNASFSFQLGAGAYRAVLDTQDRFGKKVTALLPLEVLDPAAGKLGIKVPNLLTAPSWTVEPGHDFTALWGTGYDDGRAFIEIEQRHKILKSFWTEPGQTQVLIKQPVGEELRGGFILRVTMVRENRAYLEQRKVEVPWTNKDLKVRWEHFVSKLLPGQKETWTAVITGPGAHKAVAEMVAALYDASLDAYLPHDWPHAFSVFWQDSTDLQAQFENMLLGLQYLQGNWNVQPKDVTITYRSFPPDIAGNFYGYQYFGENQLRGFARGGPGGAPGGMLAAPMERAALAKDGAKTPATLSAGGLANAEAEKGTPPPSPAPAAANLGQVSARKNLNETAFFYPHLLSDQDGVVKIQFTMPEALTRWKFLGFAHDRELRSGYLQDSAVTAKDLMVQPNPPRFLREDDLLDFTVKVTNQSTARQTGTVRLTFADARTGASEDSPLGITNPDQSFDVPAKESRSYSWRLKVPDGMGFLTYKAVASTGELSDGEEGYLPVLPRRVLVTESLPLPIRGAQTKQFDFAHLHQAGSSPTLRSQSLTVQMTSNPSWYAVMALPYLMEFPYECTEQTFNRLYANVLAQHIANSDPKIRKVFDQWKGTPALDSPLEKNQDLKSVMLEETPWLRQAQQESQARRNVAILFDDNRLNAETARLLAKISQEQLPDGAWSWFPGGPANDYITLYITTGFGRLRHLGVPIDIAPAVRSLDRLDGWADSLYREILKHGRKDQNNLTPTIAFYLYGRSFFLKDKPIDPGRKEAVDYFLGQARTYWLQLANRQSQAHLALA
ncbi:MAG: hypothetical protein JO112_12570, partial [Planctomycetes bacterium]|nr:hypothetical protein [Planctomycetota bacterium]